MAGVRHILIADDDPNDVHIVKAAFARAGYDFPFHVVPNGEQAIAYLKGEGKYADRKKFPVPSLLLLDIKMPSIDGFDVLRWVRSRPEWRVLPVIVLTNSYYGPDVNRAYDLGANSFLTKPSEFHEYVGAVKQVVHFWLIQNVIPEVGPFLNLSQAPADPASKLQDTAAAIEKVVRLTPLRAQGAPSLPPADPHPGHN